MSVPRSAFSPQYTIVLDQLSESPLVVVRLSPQPFVRSVSSVVPYGLGNPLPWPRYTTMLAPFTAALTFAHVAAGE